mgnify:CR=1 FL=1
MNTLGVTQNYIEFPVTLRYMDFKIVKTIEAKESSRVLCVKYLLNNKHYLMKEMDYKTFEKGIVRELKNSFNISHPYIATFYGYFIHGNMFITIWEYIDGVDLYVYIKTKRIMTESIVTVILSRIIHALHYLHSLNISHRDVKPENIILKNTKEHEMTVKLVDFGLSLDQKVERATSIVGTFDYMAPEIFSAHEYDATKVDVWSLGILTFELLHGYPPFQSISKSESMKKRIEFDYICAPTLSAAAKDFMSRCISPELSRVSLNELIKHPFIKNELVSADRPRFNLLSTNDISKYHCLFQKNPQFFSPKSKFLIFLE